jgi:DNA-binding transcriptional ArsR family regulator
VSDPVAQSAPQAGWQPDPVRVIERADQMKAIADPLRLRVVQLLMTDPRRSFAVKEIGAALEQPVTKLYHHVKILEAAGLIKDVETRLVSGIVEHRYQAGQRSLRFDDRLLGEPEVRSDSIAHVNALIDASREDLAAYLRREDADVALVDVTKARARLTGAQIKAIQDQIEAMVASFADTGEDNERAGVARSTLLFVMHPLPDEPDHTSI